MKKNFFLFMSFFEIVKIGKKSKTSTKTSKTSIKTSKTSIKISLIYMINIIF